MISKQTTAKLSALLTTLTILSCISTATANPPLYERGFKPPDSYTKPSEITIFSPSNGTVYQNGTLILNVNVTLPQSATASGTILRYVTYTPDWNNNETVLYYNKGYVNTIESQFPDPQRHYFTGQVELTNIPNGNHNITITAYAGGFYPDGSDGFYRFIINGTSTVFFTIGNLATVTPYIPTDRNAPHLDPIYYLLPVSVIVAVVLLSVLLYRRHRKTANLAK